MNIPGDLQPGDILGYGTMDVDDLAIKIHEGAPLTTGWAHVEVYVGGGQSVASRNGIGVRLYPYRAGGLVAVRRPVKPFNLDGLMAWFPSVDGTKYGWCDILNSIDADAGLLARLLPQTSMDCSHFADAALCAGDCPQFDDGFPQNKIEPAHFPMSREAKSVWTA